MLGGTILERLQMEADLTSPWSLLGDHWLDQPAALGPRGG